MKIKSPSFILLLLLILVLAGTAEAAKISGFENFGLTGSFHIGGVTGPGAGINFGLDAGIPLEAFTLGCEVEQLITNSEFDVNINATKFGALLRYQAIEEFLSIGVHAGVIGYMTSKDTSYHDTFSAKKIDIVGEEKNSGSYVAGSVDFKLGDFYLTPKVYLLNLGKGYLPEVDINIGARF